MQDDQLNGLTLPSALIKALDEGTWTATDRHWNTVFPADEIFFPKLYSRRLMRMVNDKWQHETDPAFVGHDDGRTMPGTLDPTRSLLFGELQGDAMIGLDYRTDTGRGPSVAFLNLQGKWVVVADTFDEFWRRLLDGA